MKSIQIICCLAGASFSFASNASAQNWQSPPVTSSNRPVQRVSADLKKSIGTWTGVRSCDERKRAMDAFDRRYNSWLGRQLRAHTGRRVGTFGYRLGTVWVENRQINGRRSCKAGFNSAFVYIDFQ